ncbi:Fibrillarin-like rRNA/tRNA 2'-O-methyltransferase [uncultured archaeon]|nr:Fibrillarin-like rRNA/tRNA 2'-O-methyltransferase [uncultured archaeon]
MTFQEIFPGMFFRIVAGQQRLATRSRDLVPVYGERIMDGYRIWDPFRSKLAALLLKDKCMDPGLFRNAKVLYLGAATGTTVSHISDIVEDGLVYAVEFSPRAMRDLLRLAERRENIIPILADAAQPQEYSSIVEPVDLVYQDVAQRNQAEISARNCERYLKACGKLLLMLKSRSIDVTATPDAVYSSEIKNLSGLMVSGVMDLQPFHQDHWAVQARRPL